MAKCFNKNLPEYQALLSEFENPIVVDSIIAAYQTLKKTDEYPSVDEAKAIRDKRKLSFSLKTREFSEALIANLVRNQIIHYSEKYGGYYVNNTVEGEYVYNEDSLKHHKRRLDRYLEKNNIPDGVVKTERTAKSFRVTLDPSALSQEDIIKPSKKSADRNTVHILQHLVRMLPQISWEVMTVKEAENYYDKLPAYQKSKVPFNKVKSFYVNGRAILIKGRVDNETAIEEVLHPLVDALYMENRPLFDNLLDEAKRTFPVLKQEIDDAYNTKTRKFEEKHRDLELVTQALTRHFANEYENEPTKSFKSRVAEFLEWFAGIIKNLYEYFTDGRVTLTPDAIKPTATLSDIAKLLNTSDLEFKLERRADPKVRYSLSNERQAALDYIKSKANDTQKVIIDKLFHAAKTSQSEVPIFAVGKKDVGANDDIVILNEKDHTYYNLSDLRKKYISTTTAIDGKLKNEEEVALNLALGNDFDKIVEGLALGKSFEDLLPNMSVLDEELSKRAYYELKGYIKSITNTGDVLIPQVVVHYDGKDGQNIAGTIDLLVVKKNGDLKIIDIKTSKRRYSTLEDKAYKEDWATKDDSLLKAFGIDVLSTEQKHNLQVNIYRRMLSNLGYTVDMSDTGTSTYHIWVDVEGKGKNQKFKGNFELEAQVFHPIGQNKPLVDAIVPDNVNTAAKKELKNAIKQTDNTTEFLDNETLEQVRAAGQTQTEDFGGMEMSAIFDAIKVFRKDLATRRDVIQTVKGAVFMDRTKEEAIERVSNQIALASIALTETGSTKRIFTELLLDVKRELEEYEKYLLNPDNASHPLYITRAKNFENFSKTFEGLYKLKSMAGVNETQKDLILGIQNVLNRLNNSENGELSVVDSALFKHVEAILRKDSNRDLDEYVDPITGEVRDPVNDILYEVVEEIGLTDYLTKETNISPDALLAISKKIWHRKRQEILDRIESRRGILKLAATLDKLSPGKTSKEIYEFMIELDEDGNHTGELVKKIGREYWEIHDRLDRARRDENGDWLEYRMIGDISKAKKEDIEYNRKIWEARSAYNAFRRAEVIDEDGNVETGQYHRYKQEFIDARNEHEMLVNGTWIMKPSKSEAEIEIYRNKYYNYVDKYYSPLFKDGVFTGKLVEKEGWFVKKEFVEALEVSKDGKVMTSQKYRDIMDAPVSDPLAQARKAYYLAWVSIYEDVNSKLPSDVADYMYGKTPRVRGNFSQIMKDKPSGVKRLWASTKKGAKEFFQDTTRLSKVNVNERGEIVQGIPIMYTGSLRKAEDLERIDREIRELEETYGKTSARNSKSYSNQLERLKAKKRSIEAKPAAEELSYDMTTTLMKYVSMAENYEVLSSIEDTMLAIQEVINKRDYAKKESAKSRVARTLSGKTKDGLVADPKANTTKLAMAKFMEMVFYDEDTVTKNVWDKISNKIIQYTSLSYVAFNVFGNLNNYVIARLNNSIEVMGQRYFSRDSYVRASKEFNLRALPDLIRRSAHIAQKQRPGGRYEPYEPTSNYEFFVDLFRMMDNKGDIREAGTSIDRVDESYYTKFKEAGFALGYMFQDAAEYNVQTKIGMAIVMDTYILNPDTGEILSLYDAYEVDGSNNRSLKEGFTTIIKPRKNLPTFKQALSGSNIKKDEAGNMLYDIVGEYNDEFRYDLRMKIREVNKQIHGNYAYEDRVVLQQYAWGKLLYQFHKWVAPAIRARYQNEYFDENLGWVEGRYKSALAFYRYMLKAAVSKGDMSVQGFLDSIALTRADGSISENERQRLENKILNVHRTNAEFMLIALVSMTHSLLLSMLAGDSDDSDLVKRIKNIAKYQASRAKKEMLVFVPSPSGANQALEFFSSPLASTRTLGEIGELLEVTTKTGAAGIKYWATGDEEDWFYNKDVYYQRGRRSGQLKVKKELYDVVPILYEIKKWEDYIQISDFFIK